MAFLLVVICITRLLHILHDIFASPPPLLVIFALLCIILFSFFRVCKNGCVCPHKHSCDWDVKAAATRQSITLILSKGHFLTDELKNQLVKKGI
jgi:energy-coupling factor transporter transmembrane protein EcfT